MRNFGGIEDKYSEYDHAQILLQSVPYDGTSTWGKGADKAFHAFLHAAENMELYDIETDSEVCKRGIHILPEITEKSSPDKVTEAVYHKTKELLMSDKFLTFIGGEHSISIGIIRAFYEKYTGLSVLQLDAHTDLRESYNGSRYNHACAMHEANKNTNLVQVGIRSMDVTEKEFLNKQKCFFAEEMWLDSEWMQKSIALLGEKVYITIDLDVFDPSIMPSTGTPEPGGLDWNTTITYLKQVFKNREVVGFDIVELAPQKEHKAADFLVAKLYYKMLSYKFEYHE
jgi:agmatinase